MCVTTALLNCDTFIFEAMMWPICNFGYYEQCLYVIMVVMCFVTIKA